MRRRRARAARRRGRPPRSKPAPPPPSIGVEARVGSGVEPDIEPEFEAGIAPGAAREPPPFDLDDDEDEHDARASVSGSAEPETRVLDLKPPRPSKREARENQGAFEFVRAARASACPSWPCWPSPSRAPPPSTRRRCARTPACWKACWPSSASRGQIDQIRPGPGGHPLRAGRRPPGVKSARVVALSDDIARSMSVAACRVSRGARAATPSASNCPTPGARRSICATCCPRPNTRRPATILPLALGETIGGEPYIADLAQDAPPADRRHHRLGQVGGGQRHDPVDPLPPAARAVPLHHDRPEDAGAVGLRRHPAPAGAGGHRPEEGHRRAEVDRARDGGPLSAHVQDRRAQRRRLQRARPRGPGQGRALRAHRADRLRRARAGRSTRRRSCAPSPCPIWWW